MAKPNGTDVKALFVEVSPKFKEALQKQADKFFGGNLSALVRRYLEEGYVLNRERLAIDEIIDEDLDELRGVSVQPGRAGAARLASADHNTEAASDAA